MSDFLQVLMYIKNMFSDLIYINGIIATELTKITENLVAIHRGDNFLEGSNCVFEHEELNQSVLNIIKKYKNNTEELKNLEKHILKHKE